MYQNELGIAVKAAREAGIALKERKNISIESSADRDLKLSSDKMSEKIIIDILSRESEYPILSEECGNVGAYDKDGYLWIVDPLDGTVNYYKNMQDLTCISIALWKGTTPILGVIYRYNADEMYCGIKGEGAYRNGIKITPSSTPLICDAVIATGFPTHRDYSTESLLPFLNVVQKFKKIRMLGAAAIMGVFVADGRVDAYYEDHIMLWDIAAAAAIVSAAGGMSQIEFLENNMCICRFFANRKLMEDFNDKGL